MDRRTFLARMAHAISAAGVLAVTDPDKLLWEPGRKIFFIPEKPTIRRATELPDLSQATSIATHGVVPLSHLKRGGIISPSVLDSIAKTGKFVQPIHRYTVTMGNGSVFKYDKDWKLLSGRGWNGVIYLDDIWETNQAWKDRNEKDSWEYKVRRS